MIDEQDLHALGRHAAGPAISCRPVDAVQARGTRLRRRRHLLRSAGVGAVVVGVIGLGLLAVDRRPGGGEPDVAAGSDPSTPATSDIPSAPPPPPPDCVTGDFTAVGPELVPPADVAEELRVLPTWTPDGEEITLARGNRWPNPCPEADIYSASDALELRANGGDGSVDAQINLSGPLPWLVTGSWLIPEVTDDVRDTGGVPGGTEQTTLRGHDATLSGIENDELRMLAWTEPDGWSWELRGYAVDEATLRAVGEALVLDSSPEGDEPAAALDPADLPAGFEVVWQQQGAPEPSTDDWTSWTVEVGEPATEDQPVQRGTQCMLKVRPSPAGQPVTLYGGVGSVPATVNGEPAVWAPWAGPLGSVGTSLTWEVAPDVWATAGCVDWDTDSNLSLQLETVTQFAESVEPVAADDPRLPG